MFSELPPGAPISPLVIEFEGVQTAPSQKRALPDALWRDLVASSPELTLVTDHGLVIRFASDSMLQMAGIEPEAALGVPLARVIHRDDWDRVLRSLHEVLAGHDTVEVDCRARFADRGWLDVNVRARSIDHHGRTWIVMSARDVTLDRHNEAALARKVELEHLLEKVQRRFIHVAPAEIDDAIGWALRELGTFLGADRGFVLRYDLAARTETMTHEWCEAGAPADLAAYHDVSFDLVPIGIDRSLAGEVIAIPDIARLGGTWSVDRDFLLAEGLKSLLEFPIIIGATATGSLGFDWIRNLATWTSDDLVALGMFASSFAQLIDRNSTAIELDRTLDQLRMGFEGSPVPLTLIDLDGTILRVNDELCELVGFSADQLEGRSADILVATDENGLNTSFDIDRVIQVELRTGHGRRAWGEIVPRAITNSDGMAISFVVRVDDVTSVRAAEAARDESEARFATLVDNLPIPVMRMGPLGDTLFANPAADDLLPRRADGAFELPEVTEQLLEGKRVAAVATGEPQTAYFELETDEGRRYHVGRFVPEAGPDGATRSLLLFTMDLTERIQHESELDHRATHDPLTDLPNRSAFLTRLGAALEGLRRSPGLVGVLFFDLDRFKVVNDSLGHGAGDELLVAIGRRLRGGLRAGDVIARLGGDEFTVLLQGRTDVGELVAAGEVLQRKLAEPVEVAGQTISISCSIGISTASKGTESPVEMMQWADAAMYQAKEHGRNRITVFDEMLAAEVRGRLELDQRLRTAVELQQFEVHFQPEVELTTGRVLGAEALLRWRTDDQLISAAEFIDLAEETGLIIPIGAWVLEEACQQAATWVARWPERDLTVRVNLSARQLDDGRLVDQVADVLARTGLAPGQLCLEITETAIMADAEASRRLLEALDSLGVSLAVDDFGTGYSSLAYLKQFPVDVLKIDRSFVDGLPGDTEDTAIVATIIRLAESLGMDVTAEGIETVEQATTLTSMGCSKGQGYHFARPMPADDFVRHLESRD
jgi:diguanylate cyclase (GGDEF)-like protein/PAS domain S-box-containing protein